jgi:hypothetical protein
MCRWALDSGGFTELSMHGRWTLSPRDYVAEVRSYVAALGRPDWIAPQDWMCEPWILEKTGGTVAEHQRPVAFRGACVAAGPQARTARHRSRASSPSSRAASPRPS